MFRGSFPSRTVISAVAGCEGVFQASLLRGLAARGHATTADAAGNVYAECGDGAPVVMVATFVDEGGWIVREVGPGGEGVLEPVGSVGETGEGRLLSPRSGRTMRVRLTMEGGRLTARGQGRGGRIMVGDSVTQRRTGGKWGVQGVYGLLSAWGNRSFEGRLVTAFVTRRGSGLACARVRPDIVLCLDGREGDREELAIPRGAGLFDRAQDLLERCAAKRGISSIRTLVCGEESRWVERMQLAPPGYQTGLVRFETKGGGEAARGAAVVMDEALGVLLGRGGDDARERHS